MLHFLLGSSSPDGEPFYFLSDELPMPTNPPPCKTFKTFEEQAKLLITRHLEASKDDLICRLKAVNYYRLTGYLHIFRETKTDHQGNRTKADDYRHGTTLDLVWKYYLFDRRLRLLLLDAIERIEIALRTHVAYYWAKSTKCSNPQKFSTSYRPDFNKITRDGNSEQTRSRKDNLLKTFQRSFDRSIDDCVLHHKEDLGFRNVEDLPIWVFVELSTIGELAWLFSGLKNNLQMEIASNFGCPDIIFFTSLITLIHHVRNACAHHARVWNRTWNQSRGATNNPAARIQLNPIVKNTSLTDWNLQWDKNQNQWLPRAKAAREFSFQKTSTAFLLTACRYFLRASAHTSAWNARVMELFTRADTPSNVIVEMGFPKHWEKHPFWTN